MLFRKNPNATPPVDRRPRLSPQQLAGHVQTFMTLASGLVFQPMDTNTMKAIGSFSFRDQERFCEQVAAAILRQRGRHDAEAISKAERLQVHQGRAWQWRSLEVLFSDLARRCGQSRLSEQVEANDLGMKLLASIERRMIDDYLAAQQVGPAEAAAVRARNEGIVDALAPATQILERNRRRAHDRRLMLRKLRAEKADAGETAAPTRRRGAGALATLAARELLRGAYARVLRR